MNFSTSGWIEKFGSLSKKIEEEYNDDHHLYTSLLEKGFIYGTNVAMPNVLHSAHTPSEDELAKANLFTALYIMHKVYSSKNDYSIFLNNLTSFYKALEATNFSVISKLLIGKKESAVLEKVFHNRIQLDDNILTKNFNKVLTNSLLFVDVLTFRKWLQMPNLNVKVYAGGIEYLLINITYHALSSKEEKTKYDNQLLGLFENSLTYTEVSEKQFDGSYRDVLLANNDAFEKQYFLDLACLAVWDDHSLEYKESEFIFGLGKDMQLEHAAIEKSLHHVAAFYETHKNAISLLQDSGPVKNFYDNSIQLVKKLILRNKKRLQKELSESKELMVLLTKATTQNLTKEEQKKVKNQLLDIFKSIPSLAIFALPGGAVLLPIFIKLIPNLLPSSFDENKVDEPNITD
jgi:hypothetical protein